MKRFLKRFRKDEDGAVTVDWVGLTAAMTGFGIAVTALVINGATEPADSVGNVLSAMQIEN